MRYIRRNVAETQGPFFFFCTQCKDPDSGKIGDFIRDEKKQTVSPVLDHLDLMKWVKENGFRWAEYDERGDKYYPGRLEHEPSPSI